MKTTTKKRKRTTKVRKGWPLQNHADAKVGTRVKIGNGWNPTYNGLRGTIKNNSRNIRRTLVDGYYQVIVKLDKEVCERDTVVVPIPALIRI